MAVERTISIIKPDAVGKNVIGKTSVTLPYLPFAFSLAGASSGGSINPRAVLAFT